MLPRVYRPTLCNDPSHADAVRAKGVAQISTPKRMRRVKSVMVREWTVALTTASHDLNDDRTWEREICAEADQCAQFPPSPSLWVCSKGNLQEHAGALCEAL